MPGSEPEDIGGIGVGITLNDTQFQATLNRVVQSAQETAARLDSILSIKGPTLSSSSVQGQANVQQAAVRSTQAGRPGNVSATQLSTEFARALEGLVSVIKIKTAEIAALQMPTQRVGQATQQALMSEKPHEPAVSPLSKAQFGVRSAGAGLAVTPTGAPGGIKSSTLVGDRPFGEMPAQMQSMIREAMQAQGMDAGPTPMEQIQAGASGGPARAAAGQLTYEQRQQLALARTAPGMARAVEPSRSPTTGLLQLFQAPIRRENIQSQALLNVALDEQAHAQKQVNAAKEAGVPIAEKDQQSLERATQDVQKYTAQLNSGEKAVSSFGLGFLGGITGALVYSTALTAVGTGFSDLQQVLAPAVDQMTGFQSTSTRVTSALGEQTVALHGNVTQALALADAQANLSQTASQYVNSQLQMTAQIKAGSQVQGQVSDVFRAASGAGQAPTGLYGGYGGLFGSSILAQQMGGGKGFLEQVAGDVNAFQGQVAASKYSTTTASRTNGVFGPQLNFQTSPPNPAAATAAQTAQTHYIEQINSDYQRGIDSLGKFNDGLVLSSKATKEQVAAFKTAADSIGGSAATFGDQLAAAGIAVTGQGGQGVSASQFQQFFTNSSIGAGIPDMQTFMSTLAPQRRAVQAQASATQQFQLGTQIPMQGALGLLAQPLLPPTTGLVAANAAEQQKINDATKSTAQAQQTLNDLYAQGRADLSSTAQIPQQLLGSITSLGKEIASVQAGITNEQAAYQTAQYNYQLYIAKRNLSDIGGLVGKNFGAGESYLGVLERQNLALSRQGQQLQFALSQRQINLQVAVAGFEVPGLTPAEMAARQDEAKLEASYAQKQLDIQKQMFSNQVQIVDIGNLRQGYDLAKQISLMMQGRAVQIDTTAAQLKLTALQAQQSLLVQEAGTYLTKVETLASEAISEVGQFAQFSSKSLDGVVIDFFNQIGLGMATLYQIPGAAGSYPGTNPAGLPGNWGSGQHASGALFNTTGSTSTPWGVVGEAGSETVAILSHPRAMTGAGGGMAVSISFPNMSVRSDTDVELITRKVVASIGRTASQIGLRQIGNG